MLPSALKRCRLCAGPPRQARNRRDFVRQDFASILQGIVRIDAKRIHASAMSLMGPSLTHPQYRKTGRNGELSSRPGRSRHHPAACNAFSKIQRRRSVFTCSASVAGVPVSAASFLSALVSASSRALRGRCVVRGIPFAKINRPDARETTCSHPPCATLRYPGIRPRSSNRYTGLRCTIRRGDRGSER